MTVEVVVMLFCQIIFVILMLVIISCMITTIVDYWRGFFSHKCTYPEKWKEIRVGPLKEGNEYIGHYSDYVRHCEKCGCPDNKRVEWKDGMG